MNRPSVLARFAGYPPMTTLLLIGYALIVAGWYQGSVSWWIGVAAIAAAGRTLGAMKRVRVYKTWLADWQAIGTPRAAAHETSAKPVSRRRKASSSWPRVVVAAVSLVVIPFLMALAQANETLRNWLGLLWLGVVLYLVFKLMAKLYSAVARRSRRMGAGTVSAGAKGGEELDMVQWALPPASSSPSRADAMRRLPEYSARLIAE